MLYIDGNTLSLSNQNDKELASKALFTCKKEESGKDGFS